MLARQGLYGVVDGYRFHLLAERKSEATIRNYVANAKRWIAWCEAHELNYLAADRDAVSIHLGELAGHAEQTTVSLRHLCIRYFYKYLVETGKCDCNPASEVKYRKPEAREVDAFSDEELKKLYAACHDFRERAIISLLVGGGLRRDEVYKVKRDDVDFDKGTILVYGKGSCYRLIAPGPTVIEALKPALEFTDELCPFAANDYVWRTVKAIAKRAVVRRVYPHRFRHTFATAFLDGGGSIEELMQILGHSRVEQSMFYAKSGRKRRALAKQGELDLAQRLRE